MKICRKISLCLICLCFLSSCANQNKKQRIAELNNSVFCISIIVKGKDFEKRVSVGTGFIIGEGLIATALHIKSKAEELPRYFQNAPSKIVAWKKFNTGEVVQFPIEIAVSDDVNDLAVYRFDAKILAENSKFSAIKPLVLAENLPSSGEEVVSAGYYGTYEFPFNSFGNVSMIDSNEDIVSDITLMMGNSGGPICSLETGEVLGVNVSVLDVGNETVRFGFAKRAAKLRELLKKL